MVQPLSSDKWRVVLDSDMIGQLRQHLIYTNYCRTTYNAAIDISRLPNLYQVYYNLSGVLTVVRSTKGEIIYISIVQQFCFPLLMEKLSSDITDAKIDSLLTLVSLSFCHTTWIISLYSFWFVFCGVNQSCFLTLNTLTSKCIFSIVFCIHFPRNCQENLCNNQKLL